MERSLNDVAFEDLLAYGVPVHCAARLVEERKSRPFRAWPDVLQRCFYDWKVPQGRRSPDVRPADQLLLMHLKGAKLPATSSASAVQGSTAARTGPWWEWSEQQQCPSTGADWQDEAFPAEFRASPYPEAMAVRVAGGPGAASGMRMRYTFLYCQIEQVQEGATPTFEFCGFELSKSEKAKLLARWQREYSELGEATLLARDASTGIGRVSESGTAPLQSRPGTTPTTRRIGEAAGLTGPDVASRLRSYHGHVWSQLRRLDGVVPATAVEIPETLQDTYRMDPFGNVVAEGAEPHSICHFEVEHLFPRKRGGLTVLQNLAAVHWHACRVRGGRLLAAVVVQADGFNPLSCGLSDSMLQDLWSARARLPAVLQGSSAFRTILSALLLTNWHRSDGRDLFHNKTGLLHTTPPDRLFDALLQAFHVATAPLVSGWHLGLLVGLSDDPHTSQSPGAGSISSAGQGWPAVPPMATVYRTFNEVLQLAGAMRLEGLEGLPALPHMDGETASDGSEAGSRQQQRAGEGLSSAAATSTAADGSSGLRRTRRRMTTTATQTSRTGPWLPSDRAGGESGVVEPRAAAVSPVEAVGKMLLSTGGRQRKRLGDSLRPGKDREGRPGMGAEGQPGAVAGSGDVVGKDQRMVSPFELQHGPPSPPPLARTHSPLIPMSAADLLPQRPGQGQGQTQSQAQAQHEGGIPTQDQGMDGNEALPSASPWAIAQFEATLNQATAVVEGPPPVPDLSDVIDSAGARYHPAMTGQKQPRPHANGLGNAPVGAWGAVVADPLPQTITLKQLRDEYALPEWMLQQQDTKHSTGGPDVEGPTTGPDGKAFWNPTFEPWRERQAAGSWVPLPGHSHPDSVEGRALGQYTSQLYLYRKAVGQRYSEQEVERLERGPAGAQLGYVVPGIHMRYAADRAGGRSAAAMAAAAAAAAAGGYGPGLLPPGQVLGIPSGPPVRPAQHPPGSWLDQAAGLRSVAYSHAEPQRMGFGANRPSPLVLPDPHRVEHQDVVRIAPSTISGGSEAGFGAGPASTPGFSPGLRRHPHHHHPGLSGIPPPPASDQEPPSRGPELTVFDAFPDPLSKYDRFLQYHSWLQQHRERMQQWEQRIDWEKKWYRSQSDFAVLQRAFLMAMASKAGVPEPQVHDPWSSLAASGATGLSTQPSAWHGPGHSYGPGPTLGAEQSFASGSYTTLPIPEPLGSPAASQLVTAPSMAASVAASLSPSLAAASHWPQPSASPALSRVPSLRLAGASPAASLSNLRGQLMTALGHDAAAAHAQWQAGSMPTPVYASLQEGDMHQSLASDAMYQLHYQQQQQQLQLAGYGHASAEHQLDPEVVQQQGTNLMHFQAWLYYVFQQQLLQQQHQLHQQAEAQALLASRLGLADDWQDAPPSAGAAMSVEDEAAEGTGPHDQQELQAGAAAGARGRLATAMQAAVGKLGLGKLKLGVGGLWGRWRKGKGGAKQEMQAKREDDGGEGRDDEHEHDGQVMGDSDDEGPPVPPAHADSGVRTTPRGTPKTEFERWRVERAGTPESLQRAASKEQDLDEERAEEQLLNDGKGKKPVAAAALRLAGQWVRTLKAPGLAKSAKPLPTTKKDRAGKVDKGSKPSGLASLFKRKKKQEQGDAKGSEEPAHTAQPSEDHDLPVHSDSGGLQPIDEKEEVEDVEDEGAHAQEGDRRS